MTSRLEHLRYIARKVFRPRTTRIDGFRVEVRPEFPRQMRKGLYKGTYEQAERILVHDMLDPSDRVLEIGTGVGIVALSCAKICGADSVLCYEANPKLAEVIRANMAMNGFDVTLRNRAVAVESGTATFHVGDAVVSSGLRDNGNVAERITVPCDAMADVVQEFRPTAVVMDCEGAEIDLLPAADLGGVRKILLEIHPRSIGREATDGLVRHLEDAGFRCIAREDKGDVLGFVR